MFRVIVRRARFWPSRVILWLFNFISAFLSFDIIFLNLVIEFTFNAININSYINSRFISSVSVLIVSLSFDALLSVPISFYKYISVTLGYTAGYLPIGLEPVGLYTYNMQVPKGRREAVRLN